MFREGKWYYYRNNTEVHCRYKFVSDVIDSGRVFIIIAQYPDGDVNVWAHENYDSVQQIMRGLTMTEGESQ